jgi:hypothetical protein
MPIVVRRMGGTVLDVSLVMAAAFSGHLAAPLFVYALARYRRVPVVAICASAGRVVFLAGVLLATNPAMLAVAYVGSWVLTLANIGAYTALMQGIYPTDQRATAMGRVRVAANLAGIVAAAVGGGILQLSPDPLPVLAAATAISLAGSIATFLIRYDDPLEPQQIAPPLRLASMAFRDRAFRRYLAAFTVLGFGNLMGATLYPLLLVDRFDAPNAFIGLYAATSAAATMIGFIVWGRLIDRGSSIALTVLNSAFLLLVPLVYMVAPSAIFLVPAAIVAGFTLAGGDLTFITNMVQLAPRGRAPEYMAAQSFALGIRGTLAPFVASALLLSTSIATTLLVVLFLAGAGTLLLRGVSARMEPRAEAEPLAEPASG